MNKKHLSLHERLISILLEKKLADKSGIAKALEKQRDKGGKLSDIMVGMGLVSKKDITAVLCENFGCPAIDLSRYKIIPEIISLIPKKIVKHYNIIPVSKMGNVLTVAMADPFDVLAIDDLKSATGFDIGPVIASAKDITNAIADYYDDLSHDKIEEIVDGIRGASEISVLDEQDENEFSRADLLKLTQEAPVVKITNILLAESVRMKASDILIEPMERELRVRYRIDGFLIEGKRPPKKIHNAIISRLKIMSDLNIAERRLPQDGRFKLRIQNREVDFRISILPSNMGEKAALRILDKAQANLDVQGLGFEQKSLEDLKRIAARPHGMILVCGPTGCGKTTTLYSVLKYIDSPEKNIITVEDPVEYQLAGINQVAVKTEVGLTFASSMRSILRQDPDVIMIGEIRDYKTVDVAIKAALTGHLVLSTLHTTTASGSIVRLMNMGVEPFLISSSLLLVVSQRLFRKLCPQCKEAYKLEKHIVKNLRLHGDITVYKSSGCSNCRDTGYKGRIGAAETFVLTPEIKDLILDKARESALTELAYKQGMQSLRKNAISKMLSGLTSAEEVLRLTIADQGSGSE